MTWIIHTLHDWTGALSIGPGFWSFLLAGLLLIILTLSGLTARVVGWARVTLQRT